MVNKNPPLIFICLCAVCIMIVGVASIVGISMTSYNHQSTTIMNAGGVVSFALFFIAIFGYMVVATHEETK